MTTDTEVATEAVRPLSGKGPAHASAKRRWRLPITYSAIAPIALTIDLAIIVVSAISAEFFYHSVPSELGGEFSHTIAAAVFVAILFVAVMRIQKLYSPARLVVIDDQARSVLAAWCGAFFILASGVFTWGVSHDLSRGDILLFWAIGAVALLAHRIFWRAFLPSALESGALRGRRVVSMTCEDSVPPRFVENLSRFGYQILDHFHVPAGEPLADEVIDTVISTCRTADIEEVLLFVDPERMGQLRSIAKRLRVLPLPVTLVPFGTLAQLFQRAHSDIGDTVAIELQRAALSPVEQAVKRLIDILVSMTALVLLAPLMILVAVAIKLESKGPVLFRQTRHGFNGRPFGIYKFRSMSVMENGDVVRQAEKNDKRVTRVGYWLRRLSIDRSEEHTSELQSLERISYAVFCFKKIFF